MNKGIHCDVEKCMYNADSCLCELTEVKIAYGSGNDTCCASFEEK